MKGKMIFIIIAFALIIIVSIGYFVYGNKNTSSKIENIATKEENIVKDIIVTNETTQNTITEIIEQEKTEIEIPEQIEIQENIEKQEEIIAENEKVIEKPIQNNNAPRKQEKEVKQTEIQPKENIQITNKTIPIQEKTNNDSSITETQKSVEIELDTSTKFDIDDGGYAEWGQLTEEKMKALGF